MRKANRLLLCILIFSLTAIRAFGANIEFTNPRALALGGGAIALTGVGLGADNPASLAQTSSGLSISYNNFYGLQGYEVKSGSFAIQTKLGTLGFVYNAEDFTLFEERMGRDYESLWGEQNLAFGYAAAIGRMNFGLSILHTNQNVYSDYDENTLMNKNDFLFNLGFQLNSERFGFGCTVKNLGGEIEPEIGVGFRFGKPDNLVAIVDVLQRKDIFGERNATISGGLEAWVRDNFALRISLDKAGMVSVGLGAKSGRIKADYAYQIHPVGNTHYLATSYLF